MHKIDSDGATIDNKFTEGNPATSTPATIVSAAILNAFQEEIVNVVEDAGLTLLTSGTDTFDQMLNALKIIIQNGGTQYQQSLSNNAGPLDIGGAGVLEFNPATVHAVVMKYHIKRRTDSQDKLEVGELALAYNTETSSWETPAWNSNFDTAGVSFSMDLVVGGANAGFGKIKYTTNDLTGTTYSGILTIADVKIIKQ